MSVIYISHSEMDKHYHLNEENEVIQNDPTVKIVLNTLPDQPFDSEEEQDEEFDELDAFFGGILSEFRDGTFYARWPSYQLFHKEIWQRDYTRHLKIRNTINALRKRVRLLANPVIDAASFLRIEHSKILSKFDSLGEWSDLAFSSTRSSAADYILTKVWFKGEPPELPFGDLWTVSELQEKDQSYWADDEVWTWQEFWQKANPMLAQYLEAIDCLIIIRLLQHYIERCEINAVDGFRYFIKTVQPKIQKHKLPKSQSELIDHGPLVSQYKSFAELFNNSVDEDFCIKALLDNDGQHELVDVSGAWIGKKGSISLLVAWIDRMEYYKQIRVVDRKKLLPLLATRFPGLKLGSHGRQWSYSNATFMHYKVHFHSILVK